MRRPEQRRNWWRTHYQRRAAVALAAEGVGGHEGPRMLKNPALHPPHQPVAVNADSSR